MADDATVNLEDIVSLAKRRGFIFQGSEIYGGLSGTFDYGPMGVELKRNIESSWWKTFVHDRDDVYGLDASILMNPQVFKASGHLEGFSDPMVECLACNSRFRADHLLDTDEYRNFLSNYRDQINQWLNKTGERFEEGENIVEYFKTGVRDKKLLDYLDQQINLNDVDLSAQKVILEELSKAQKNSTGRFVEYFLKNKVECPVCSKNKWGIPKSFNMMFETTAGAAGGEEGKTYLRPETAQGIFVNFKNVLDSMHPELPFGIAQIGKAFRNEIAPRDFLFRTREFEQMEIEYFVRPDTWEEQFETWADQLEAWLTKIGIDPKHVFRHDVPEEERAHYSDKTIDFEFTYPFGVKELIGLAYRTDYDLRRHQEESGEDLRYTDRHSGEKILPHVIEPSLGTERIVLALLCSAYREEGEQDGEKRTYLALPAEVAPVKVAVFPLLKNKPELVEKARAVYAQLKEQMSGVAWDDNGNIGKRYRRQDEIGTPYCVTIDFDTLEDDTVTIRDRDTLEQRRVSISELFEAVQNK